MTPAPPHLLYVGDAPVESSYHGSALLYRLLEGFPQSRLRILEGVLSTSVPERRLKGVHYASLLPRGTRLLNSRARPLYAAWLQLSTTHRAARAMTLCRPFSPEAVLTVMHGYSWKLAAKLAARLAVPLHVVCHDDWPRFKHGIPWLRGKMDADFGRVYRQASSRFCVSPFMSEAYLARYGVAGDVLYPSRARDCPVYSAPPSRVLSPPEPFTIAYGGTINSSGIVRSLAAAAKTLASIGGRLLLFGPHSKAAGNWKGLEGEHVRFCGLLPSSELIERFRAEADLLFLPIPFDAASRPNMEIHFPSKLTDYTAAGLPILIQAPPYSSASRWANAREEFAEIVETDEDTVLDAAILRLHSTPQRRLQLGARSLEVGDQYFGPAAAEATFYAGLGRSASGGLPRQKLA